MMKRLEDPQKMSRDLDRAVDKYAKLLGDDISGKWILGIARYQKPKEFEVKGSEEELRKLDEAWMEQGGETFFQHNLSGGLSTLSRFDIYKGLATIVGKKEHIEKLQTNVNGITIVGGIT